MDKEIATLILQMLEQVAVKADDRSLNNALAARQWLGRIAEGSTVLTPVMGSAQE